ncbi:ankyrin repeat-containing domain protein [Trichophaea hybrida]|nr:ankyrin repeat-containing domain protein [Trichophaea hybrida]
MSYLLDNQDLDTISILVEAVQRNSTELVQFLLEAGTAVDALSIVSGSEVSKYYDYDYETSLQVACRHGFKDIVTLLRSYGADPRLHYLGENLPFFLAMESSRTDIVELLLKVGASANEMHIDNEYPIHLAIEKYDIAMIRLFLKYGGRVNEINRAGDIALHLAVTKLPVYWKREKFNGEAARLLEAGAEVDCLNYDGFALFCDTVEWFDGCGVVVGGVWRKDIFKR